MIQASTPRRDVPSHLNDHSLSRDTLQQAMGHHILPMESQV